MISPAPEKSRVSVPKVARKSQALRRQAAEEKILRAAAACVAEHGVEGFKLGEVGRRAGLSAALVHYHFAAKAGLIERLVVWLLDSEGFGRLEVRSDPGLDALIEILGDHFDRLAAAPVHAKSLWLLQSQAVIDPGIAKGFAVAEAQMLSAIERHLRAGLGRGEVDGAVHAKNHARLILTDLRGAISWCSRGGEGMTVEEVRLAWSVSLRRGLAAR